jgi:hypothetical protein
MNASVERPAQPPVGSSTTVQASTAEKASSADDKICWVEFRESPYQPDQQVELLHLQAEADALLLQLQAACQKRRAEVVMLAKS